MLLVSFRSVLRALGDHDTGKTSLIWAYTKLQYMEDQAVDTPAVLDTNTATIPLGNERQLHLEIVDSENQDSVKEGSLEALRFCDVFILCYNCVEKNTFENAVQFWIKELDLLKPKNFVLCGNRFDLHSRKEKDHVSRKEAEAMKNKTGAFKAFNCSAKHYGRSRKRLGCVNDAFLGAIKLGLLNRGEFNTPWIVCKCNIL